MNTKRQLGRIRNEDGSILIFTLLIMLILTIIGLSASTTTEIELKIAANDTLNKKAFLSADSGISYAISKTSLYDDDNTDPAVPVSESHSPTDDLSFAVTVAYVAGTTGGNFARGPGIPQPEKPNSIFMKSIPPAAVPVARPVMLPPRAIASVFELNQERKTDNV